MVFTGTQEIKKADSVIAADSNGTYIIDKCLKFVKGNKEDAREILSEIYDLELLSAVSEHILMRAEKGKDKKMTARSIKMLLKHLKDVCRMQEIPPLSCAKVQVAMLNKATRAGWLSVYSLEQSELKLILAQKNTSYSISAINAKVNNFD